MLQKQKSTCEIYLNAKEQQYNKFPGIHDAVKEFVLSHYLWSPLCVPLVPTPSFHIQSNHNSEFWVYYSLVFLYSFSIYSCVHKQYIVLFTYFWPL